MTKIKLPWSGREVDLDESPPRRVDTPIVREADPKFITIAFVRIDPDASGTAACVSQIEIPRTDVQTFVEALVIGAREAGVPLDMSRLQDLLEPPDADRP